MRFLIRKISQKICYIFFHFLSAVVALSLFTVILTSCATQPQKQGLVYSSELFKTKPFIAHADKGSMQSYLVMNLDFTVLASLRKQIEGELHLSLKDRGEGHITVISPIEFERVLSKKLSMAEINDLSNQMKIQEISFKPVCIGRGNLTVAGRDEQTFYIVIQSEGLFKIRQEIQKLFIAKGGNASAFDPDLFYPHATIGYTSRDLHYEDGVIKDERSCILKLHKEK